LRGPRFGGSTDRQPPTTQGGKVGGGGELWGEKKNNREG